MTDALLWQRWEEVDRLLDEALDLPAEQQVSHIRHRAADDPALRDLVLRLLGRLADAGHRITGPSESVVLGAFGPGGEDATFEDLVPGTVVGRYIIGARRGRGGMATVYEAERSDGTYRQQVALKVLRRGLDTEDLIGRFLTERQILSSFAHPNIARLLDGGALEDGRPYLVMELVDGRPITTYADAAQLDLRSRVELFLQVVDAIRAAHRRLVVHRDIKPSNILVDADGHAKLLDFGIAKLLEADGAVTESRWRVLTPDYASPEQIRGDPITTGSDVYQLGLLLRELLTGLSSVIGDRPSGEPPSRPSRVVRLEAEGAPSPEARAAARSTTAAKLAGALRGDLDLIIDTALRPVPDDRYTSADEFAADLRSYLEGHPIRAHPESARYRIRKFIGRHPLFLPGAVAVTVALAAFIVMLEVQNRRVGRQRDAAEAASRQALATQAFLVDLLRSPDPTTGASAAGNRDITVVDALHRGRVRIATELQQQPGVHAAVLTAIGRTFTGLGRYETADTLLGESLRLHNDLYGPSAPASTGVLTSIARNHRSRRDFKAADSVYHDVLRLHRLAGRGADTAVAGLLSALSTTRRELGDVDSAIALANRSVVARQETGDTVGERFADALGALAYVLRGANQLDSAETVYREVLRHHEQAAVPDPNAIAGIHNNLGYLLRTRSDFASAEHSYREAIRLVQGTLGAGHPTTTMYSNNLASVLEFQGKLDEVVEIARVQIAAAEREWPQGHWRVGAAYAALGRFLLRNRRETEALAPLEAAARSYEKTLGPRHTWTALAAAHLGAAQLIADRPQGGAVFDRALAVLRERSAALDADNRLQLGRIATLLDATGHRERSAQVRRLLPD